MKNSTYWKTRYFLSPLLHRLCNKRLFLVPVMLLCCTLLSAQQPIFISGVVVSADDNSLIPGVTVQVKGSNKGATTNEKGKYFLEAKAGDSLVFRYIGFIEKRVKVGNQQTINISLQSISSQLKDVVVVAFGTKKKSDMVGSVTTIRPSDLKVPSSNLTTALAGRAAGVIAFQRSGEPGQDNAQFFIRGVTTFGYKKDPLILIDGVELTTTDLARLQVDDIASFSILKDASATALYGSRAANGVILVTTKSGAVGKAHLSFRIENSLSAPTKNIELADPVTYMKLANEAVLTRDPLGALPYSDQKIDNTIAGTNPTAYPANDWRKQLFKDNTMNQRLNLSISGGGGVARYYVSGAYNRDNGLMKVDRRNNFNNNIRLNSYSLRSNVNVNLTNTTEMVVRLSGSFDDYSGPLDGGASMYQKVMRANPVLFPAYYPADEAHRFVKHIMFGNYEEGQYINPYADMVKGYKDYSRSLMLAQIELKQNLKAITPGLVASGMVNTNRTSYFDVSRFYNPFWYDMDAYDKLTNTYFITNTNPNDGTEYLGYREGDKTISTSFYLESRLNYDRTFDKSGVSGMLVFMAQNRLNANAGDLQQSLPFRNLGLSGRATYDYDKRYYAEINFGYNGSERFDKNHRFGFFPSVGIAWTLSNEKFFDPIKLVVSNARLRATYGIIGNDAIGSPQDRFFYLSNVNMNDQNRQATFGRDPGTLYSLNGISISRYANQDITWETSKQKNIALELGLFNKLNITAEYFSQYRDHILMTRAAIPEAAGFAAPIRANVGIASAKGVDISMDYKQFFKNDFWASAMANFTYASSKYENYEEPKYNEWYRYHTGYSINQTFGYIAEKLFVDDKEAANSPKQNFGQYGGGDIKYLDVNRDGQITEADKVPIGNPTVPEIVYGFGFSMGYKNLDISAFFQGMENESFWIDPSATSPFASYTYPGEIISGKLQNQLLKAYADDHWSEDNQNVHALWPRLSPTVNQNNAQTSTWFMRDGAFLRLKQVEIGYTLPARWQKKMRTSTCRFYLNATNLLSFSKFNLWDVEMGGNGLGYPVQRVFNIGLNLGFN
ncbi:SusC/RagA family TonB-linked outer membrane protein [Chitinophaga sp. 22321]|uniref:TonB-dependent receptor n=1 Tax=Chitinophaga hostae TaxID=2831022 RepID=A0ABS5J3S9_9BACT|nr:TonB-dependent receptor [Chitinophaga hostae]MBS0029884.1 TonB-dependent receptor [Chitinophaga hostae]